MPYGTKVGVYEANLTAGTEVSSTYEGRHLTFLANEINFGNVLAVVTKGYPVLVGENIVGVPFKTEVNRTDQIAIDTEGIWNLSVVATDEDGSVAVVRGDELFIDKASCVLSKNRNKNTHVHFGYALGVISSGNTAVIAVKVHWNPDDSFEKVGTHDVPEASAHADKIFREYRYRSSSITGDIRGQYMELLLAGAGVSGEAGRNRTWVEAAVATAHGCHDGIEFAAGGSITGLGVGHRATGKFPNRALWATIAGGMSELFADGASTNYATATSHAIHRFVNDGETTGKATAQNVWSFAGLSATQLQNHSAWVNGLAKVLRVLIEGDGVYYVGLSNAA